jgi:nucleoside phosphorylase
MAQEEQQQQQQQQQGITCTGDCLQCSPNQRAYCAAQFTYRTMRMVEMNQAAIAALTGYVATLKEKIEAMQSNEEKVFDPTSVAVPSKRKEQLFQEETQ